MSVKGSATSTEGQWWGGQGSSLATKGEGEESRKGSGISVMQNRKRKNNGP